MDFCIFTCARVLECCFFSLEGHIMRSHHAWFFEDALTSDTAKKQTLWLLIFLYQRVFTKVLIEKGTVAFSRGRVLPDKSLIRKGWALLRKTLIDPEESHKGV